ncbi:MAG TPA: isochorismatase family cysteine hydrolase [Herpetosiphonaceae bacterium]
MTNQPLTESALPFLRHLDEWQSNLPALSLDAVIGGAPERVAVACVDIINGFCTEGPLASPRVQSIVAPIAGLFGAARERGVRHFLLPQDAHPEDAVEFGSFPPHCVRGTSEAGTAPELLALPFADEFTIFEKNTLSAAIETEFAAWVRAHPEVTTYVVTGDCSDLCIYQLAMFLRMDANARNIADRRVILPANCVDTYDVPVSVAREVGIYAHPGDLHHVFFLHHMALNGVEVVGGLE